MAKTMMVRMSDEALKAIVRIIPNGGAAKALDELVRRRENGEEAYAFHVPANNSIVVGPIPADEDEGRENQS